MCRPFRAAQAESSKTLFASTGTCVTRLVSTSPHPFPSRSPLSSSLFSPSPLLVSVPHNLRHLISLVTISLSRLATSTAFSAFATLLIPFRLTALLSSASRVFIFASWQARILASNLATISFPASELIYPSGFICFFHLAKWNIFGGHFMRLPYISAN